ncbi:hypothetical protein Tco_1337368, partial [Tanacetum coccineum]
MDYIPQEGFNPLDLRGAELFFGTSKASISIVLKTPGLPKDTTRITREISLNQGETCSSYQMDENTSTEDAVKAFLKSVHLRARPPITKEKLEAGLPCDFYDLLAVASSVPIGVRDERDDLHRQIDSAYDSIASLGVDSEMLKNEKARLNEWADGNLELERLEKITIRFEFQEALKRSSKELMSLRVISNEENCLPAARQNCRLKGEELAQITNEVEKLKVSVKLRGERLKLYKALKDSADRVVGQTSDPQSDPEPVLSNEPKVLEASALISGLIGENFGSSKAMQDLGDEKMILSTKTKALSECQKELRNLEDVMTNMEKRANDLKVNLKETEDLLFKMKPEISEREQRARQRELSQQ